MREAVAPVAEHCPYCGSPPYQDRYMRDYDPHWVCGSFPTFQSELCRHRQLESYRNPVKQNQ